MVKTQYSKTAKIDVESRKVEKEEENIFTRNTFKTWFPLGITLFILLICLAITLFLVDLTPHYPKPVAEKILESKTLKWRFPEANFTLCCSTMIDKQNYLKKCNEIFKKEKIECFDVTEGSIIVELKSYRIDFQEGILNGLSGIEYINGFSTNNHHKYEIQSEPEKVPVVPENEEDNNNNIFPAALHAPTWFANLNEEDKTNIVALLSQGIKQYGRFSQDVKQDLITKFQIEDYQPEELYKFVYHSDSPKDEKAKVEKIRAKSDALWSTIPPRERIPLLSKNETTGRWFLPTEAEEKLSNTDFQDQLFHVVGIGGPTRTGKSFIMSTLLEKFDEHGTVHFGSFLHEENIVSVTKGIDIALVEYKEQLILLLDCEGMHSISSTVDPKLIVMVFIITQKLMYVEEQNVNNDTLQVLSDIIINRNGHMDPRGIPLNTLYMICNQSTLQRSANFFETKLNAIRPPTIKDTIITAFPNRNSFYISDTNINEGLFRTDINTLFQDITLTTTPFSVQNIKYPIARFIAYLKDIVQGVNDNTRLQFLDAMSVQHKSEARNKMEILKKDIPTCEKYYNEQELESELAKIKMSKESFEEFCKHFKHYIEEEHATYLLEFDDYIVKFKEQNEQFKLEAIKEVKSRIEEIVNNKEPDTEEYIKDEKIIWNGMLHDPLQHTLTGTKMRKCTYKGWKRTTITYKSGAQEIEDSRLESADKVVEENLGRLFEFHTGNTKCECREKRKWWEGMLLV